MDGFWKIKYIQGEPQHQGYHESSVEAISKMIPISRIIGFKSGNVMVPFDIKMCGKLNFIENFLLIFKKNDRLIF